ncbi:hypothetical protein [Salinibaculum rarum]|uniref:hypothetical protein n=1 Tax=Salinibaculum rarum TaxID=3058903 RepID=UPI00265D6BCC|nr:hypothetical protein [Salinibaculum sp. KK48]
MSGSQLEASPTLLEQLTQASQVDRVAETLPIPVGTPSYLYVSVFILLDGVILNTYTHLTGGTHAVVRNPFHIALYLSILLATVGAKYMHDGHVDAMSVLVERGICDTEQADDYALSLRTKLLFYAVGLVGFFSYQVFVIGIDTVLQIQGIAGVAFTLVVLPGCYLPVAIDFVSEYTTLHILIPRWLRKQDVGLFFFDPQDMGGFQPIGSLLKNSYYFYTGGLLLYLVFYYGLFITPIEGSVANPPGAAEATMFTVLWLFGLLTISHSMYKIHKIMKSERETQLRTIEHEIHDIIDNPHDISKAEIADQDRLDNLEYRLGQIQATSEYPTTFTMWTQIGISVLLPQILQLSLQATV